jgi:hypothetical protein
MQSEGFLSVLEIYWQTNFNVTSVVKSGLKFFSAKEF